MNGVRAAMGGPKFAVVKIMKGQFRVAEGDRVQTSEPLWADIGENIRLKKVFMVGGEQFTAIGRPLLANAAVEATVEEHFRSKVQYNYKRLNQSIRGGRWIDVTMPSTILRINKITFSPEMKVAGSDELYRINEMNEEEAEALDAKEAKMEPVKWNTNPNGPLYNAHINPQIDPEIADYIKWRKMDQIQNLRHFTPGMRYWWWPKDRFESNALTVSR